MRKTTLLLILSSLLIAGPGHTSTPGKINNFEGGGTQNWREGSGSPNPPTNVASGGPEGAGEQHGGTTGRRGPQGRQR